MPRQPEFDRSQVLDRALDLFWSHGYESSSISKLLDAMEMNRGSLYAAFGDKSSLFKEVLEYYMDLFHSQLYGPTLVTIEDPVQAIRGFFQLAFIELEDRSKLVNGCLLLNAITALHQTEPELAAKANDKLLWIRELILARVTEAQQAGMVSLDKDSSVLADYLIALLAGLRTLCKSGADQASLQLVIDAGLSSVFE